MNPLRFIDDLWSIQPDGHFFLCYFDEAHIFRERSFIRQDGTWKRKPRLLSSGVDLYFCPNSFTQANRRNSYTQQGRWLYADLDEVHPNDCKLKPSIAWETSPGRYQAAWLLDEDLSPDQLSLTNKFMTYLTGADKGGWSLTKVLRIPGSVSHKRDKPFEVKLLWGGEGARKSYPAERLYAKAQSARRLPDGLEQPLADTSARKLVTKYNKQLSIETKRLLRTKPSAAQSSDRSAMLWKLENLLLEAGLNAGEVFVLAKASAFNKYRGQEREEAQLWHEIERAAARLDTDKPPAKRARPAKSKQRAAPKRSTAEKMQRTARRRAQQRAKAGKRPTLGMPLQRFLAQPYPPPHWLVKDVWSAGNIGVISGEWKGYKSLIALDLALSIATASPFLETFPCGDGKETPKPQSVLYLHEEGGRGLIQDRLVRIAESKGLVGAELLRAYRRGRSIDFSLKPGTRNDPWGKRWAAADDFEIHLPPSAPLHISSFPGLDLTNPEDQQYLLDSIVLHNHKFVVLESLYLITGDADENEAADLRPVLQGLSQIARLTGCSIAVSHHYKKGDRDARRLARLSGHGILARWLESGIFLERVGEENEHVARMDMIHREHPSPPSKWLKFNWDEEVEDDYNVQVFDSPPDSDEIEVPAYQNGGRSKKPRGNESRTKSGDNKRRVIKMVAEATDAGVDLSVIAEHTGLSAAAIRRCLREAQFEIRNGRAYP